MEALADDPQVIAADCDEPCNDLLATLEPGIGTFLFHVDLTFTSGFPRDRSVLLRDLYRRGITPLNEGVVDISKRSLHSLLRRLHLPSLHASRDGDPEEWLIIKSNLNAHGHPERHLSASDRETLALLPDAAYVIDPYQIMARREVTAEHWTSPAVITERFVENAAGRFFRAYLAGRALIVCESRSPALIKKMGYGLPRETFLFRVLKQPKAVGATRIEVQRVAQDVWTLASRMRLDFGTIDLVEDERGTTYICDVNSTPYWNENEPDMVSFLREGLTSLCWPH